MENEISKIDSRITDLRLSRRRQSCPNDLNFESQPSKVQNEIAEHPDQPVDEEVINDKGSDEMAFWILCIFFSFLGISLLIIILLFWPAANH